MLATSRSRGDLRPSPAAIVAFGLLLLSVAALCAADARTRILAFNTARLVAGTLLIALPLGSILGLLVARTDVPFRRLAAAAIGLLLIVPLYLQAAAWQAGFGLYGWYTLAVESRLTLPWLSGWRGAIWVHAMAAVPWIALFVGMSARQVEPQLEEAALLDAPARRVFASITLRRVWPALGLAALWVALSVATDMTVTDLYQVRTYAEEVYVDFAAPTDLSSTGLGPWAGPAVVAMLAAAAVALIAGGARHSARLLPKRPHVFELGAWRWPATLSIAAYLALSLGVPVFNLTYKAGVVVQPRPPAEEAARPAIERSWSAVKAGHIALESPKRYAREILWSGAIAAIAATTALLCALPLAWLGRRGGLSALPALLTSTAALATPAPLLGIGLIQLLNDPALPFSWMYHTIAAPSLAQAIRALPLTIFIAWLAFRTIPQEQFEAAAVDGAGHWSTFARIALARRRPVLVAAWAAAFLLALAELPATLLLEAPGRMTLPIAVFQLLHGSGEDRLAGIALFMILAYALVGTLAIAIFARRTRRLALS